MHDSRKKKKTNRKDDNMKLILDVFSDLGIKEYLLTQNGIDDVKIFTKEDSVSEFDITYNDKITLVPSNIVAKMFGFQEEKLFEIEDYKRENINIKLED